MSPSTPSSAPDLTPADLAGAEHVAAADYTPAERAQIFGLVARRAADVVRRRAVPLPHDLGPATRFDPRLPGFEQAEAHGPARELPVPPPLTTSDVDVAYAPLEVLAGWIRTRALSSRRLTEIYLARIGAHDGQLLAFARVTADLARAQADAADALLAAGTYLGPLHGIPYGLKDLVDTAGIVTDWGAAPYLGRVAEGDAHVVGALRDAGAVLLGKTSVGELAWDETWYGGRTNNPWLPAEGSSGSSAGSAAALAAGLCAFAIGTETWGSIVSPARRCGTAGLRPTFGRVSRRGVMPLCWSLDKLGALGRTIADTAIVVGAMATPDMLDAYQISVPWHPAPALPAHRPLAGWTLGFFPADFADETVTALDRAALDTAQRLGAVLIPLERRALPYNLLTTTIHVEAGAAFEELVLSGAAGALVRQTDHAWPTNLRAARLIPATEHIQLDRLRRLAMLDMDAAFAKVDIILGPPAAGDMCLITNFTGHPCASIVVGYRQSAPRGTNDKEGDGKPARVPHSVVLWSKLYDEGRLVAAASALEAAFGAIERPSLFS
ncbi:hypothetical protein Q5752_002181 [Cryptotrichosporon argae]